MKKAWLFLAIAIVCEICGTSGMRALAVSHPGLSLASATCGIVISYFFASRAMEYIPVGLYYAVWSGVGIAGISIISWLFFNEAMPLLKIIGLFFIIGGMISINLSSHARAS